MSGKMSPAGRSNRVESINEEAYEDDDDAELNYEQREEKDAYKDSSGRAASNFGVRSDAGNNSDDD